MRCFAIAILLLPFLWLGQAGCIKEYSAEERDSIIVTDTLHTEPLPDGDTSFVVAPCYGCSGTIGDNEWTLTINGTVLCGEIDTAIVSFSRNALTFFGPSHCSADSGLIISVWLQPQALNRDWSHLAAGFASFYYYDNIGGGYMLLSDRNEPIALTITKYDHTTKKAEGVFSGVTYTDDGKPVVLRYGKWKTWLK